MNNDNLRSDLKELRVCIIIPTYNNEGTIAQVIEAACACCEDVIVVNDGATDGTAEIVSQSQAKVCVIGYAPNRGKGYALRTAFKEAQRLGFEYAVTMDADGQHSTDDLPLFIEKLRQHPQALLVGSRPLNAPNMPQQNTFANKFSNFWFQVQTAHKLPDTQSGFRVYPLNKISKIHLFTTRYETELEILVRSKWKGIHIVPVPIHVYYPPKEERVSHFRPRTDFFRISVLNALLCIFAIIYGYPSMLFHKLFSSR